MLFSVQNKNKINFDKNATKWKSAHTKTHIEVQINSQSEMIRTNSNRYLCLLWVEVWNSAAITDFILMKAIAQKTSQHSVFVFISS